MKKATIILLLLLSAFTVSAVSVKTGLGVISSLGVSFNTGRWDFSASMLSSFPAGPLAYKLAPKVVGRDVSFGDWAAYSSGLLFGGGTSASFRVIDSEKHTLSAGLATAVMRFSDNDDGLKSFISNYNTMLLSILMLQAQYTFNIDRHSSLFFSCGFPFMGLATFVGIPGNNDSYTFSLLFFVPSTFREIEENFREPGLTGYALTGAAVLPMRIGYIYTF